MSDQWNTDQECQIITDFLERVNQPEYRWLKMKVSAFLTSLRPDEPLPETVHSFMTGLKEKLQEDQLLLGIESFLLSSLYPRHFKHILSLEQLQDHRLHYKLSALNLYQFGVAQLGLQSLQPMLDTLIQRAGLALLTLDEYKNAYQKIQVLVACHQIIAEEIQSSDFNTDLILPIIILIVLKSHPPRLCSNLKYIQLYTHPCHQEGRSWYCLTNMMAAVKFIETLDLHLYNPPAILSHVLQQDNVILLNNLSEEKNDTSPVSYIKGFGQSVYGLLPNFTTYWPTASSSTPFRRNKEL